jgi:hypothetical protein
LEFIPVKNNRDKFCYFQPEADQPLAEVLNKIGICDLLLFLLGTMEK